jgi:hypothetical protein
MKFALGEAKKNSTDLKTSVRLLSLASNICGKTADVLELCVAVFTVPGREGAKIIYISLDLTNYRNKTNMLLIIFLGLFTTLTAVSGECDVGKQEVTSVNFPKVGIRAWTLFPEQVILKPFLWFTIQLFLH